MRQWGQGYNHSAAGENVSFLALQFPIMLFHVVAAAVLTNIAVLEIYSLYDTEDPVDVKILSGEIESSRLINYKFINYIV